MAEKYAVPLTEVTGKNNTAWRCISHCLPTDGARQHTGDAPGISEETVS
jgi:hypothetical protein